jgi:ubiquinone/menaquinone biosynthesis C-methylase UbiE
MKLNDKETLINQINNDPYFGEAVRFVLNKLGSLKGKVIFESGCGSGEMSVFFALQGASIIGIDKDRSRLGAARRLADSLEVQSRCLFLQGSAEECPLDSTSIDIIFSKSTIQYMNRDRVLSEYLRLLKPGGNMALLENLPYNPLINIYRFLRRLTATTQAETVYVDSIKGYINCDDIDRLTSCFRLVEQQEYHLLGMSSIYLLKNQPSSSAALHFNDLIAKVDTSLLTSIPLLRKLAWLVAIYCENKQN